MQVYITMRLALEHCETRETSERCTVVDQAAENDLEITRRLIHGAYNGYVILTSWAQWDRPRPSIDVMGNVHWPFPTAARKQIC